MHACAWQSQVMYVCGSQEFGMCVLCTAGVTAVISMLPSTEHVADAYEGVSRQFMKCRPSHASASANTLRHKYGLPVLTSRWLHRLQPVHSSTQTSSQTISGMSFVCKREARYTSAHGPTGRPPAQQGREPPKTHTMVHLVIWSMMQPSCSPE